MQVMQLICDSKSGTLAHVRGEEAAAWLQASCMLRVAGALEELHVALRRVPSSPPLSRWVHRVQVPATTMSDRPVSAPNAGLRPCLCTFPATSAAQMRWGGGSGGGGIPCAEIRHQPPCPACSCSPDGNDTAPISIESRIMGVLEPHIIQLLDKQRKLDGRLLRNEAPGAPCR